jgi:squalene-hopene/tetraprenyl-beta-curcumene cyclase
MIKLRPACLALPAGLLFTVLVPPASAQGPDPKDFEKVLDKAILFLKKQQNPDGSFSPKIAGPGVSALVVAGLLHNGMSPRDPFIAKTMAYLESKVQKDGGIYDKFLANYTTSVSLMAFRQANQNGKYDALIRNSTRFLKSLQYDDSVDENDPKFGGIGYDKNKRPDLSNTQYFVDALLEAGVPPNDPAVQRALIFINRCQNLAGEQNDQAFAKKASPEDKGGFTYTPVDPGNSPHKTPAGGLRSSAGMTYAGLKSFLHAGVSKDDPRVKTAVQWIRAHYTLSENPGQGQAGLYYYYHTFGKAMKALGEDPFVDSFGKKHDWRRELFQELQKRQRPDGSWINDQDKQFGENNADLATAFAILTLSYCRSP